LRMPLIEEAQPRMLKFRKGEIDWIGLDMDNFVRMATKDAQGDFHLKAEYAERYRIYWEESLSASYYTFNFQDELIGKNVELRRAIAWALDTPRYIDMMANGRGAVLNTIVPLPIAGCERDVTAPAWYATNIEEAKACLTRAGYPGGEGLPELVIDYGATNQATRQDYEFQRAQLAKVGIALKPVYSTHTTYMKKVESGNFQIASAGWNADFPDAENFYQLLYGPNSAPGPNDGSYKNAEFDALYEQIRAMSPSSERNELLGQMATIVHRDVPVVLTYTPIVLGLIQPWVGNMKRNLMHDAPFRFLDIDAPAKSQASEE
jgi:oligopeptide transport system substrate-binding protein